MRTINELLKLIESNISFNKPGLCSIVWELWDFKIITLEEKLKLLDYIKSNRPWIFSSWEAFMYFRSNHYWRPFNMEPRIKWLRKHIRKTSK